MISKCPAGAAPHAMALAVLQNGDTLTQEGHSHILLPLSLPQFVLTRALLCSLSRIQRKPWL